MDPWLYLLEFRAEASEHLRALDAHLLDLEADPCNAQAIRAMLLSAHSIKGGAAMLGLADVRRLAHALEDILAQLRDTQASLEPPTADRLFRAIDLLRDLVGHATPDTAPGDRRVHALETDLRARVTTAPTEPGCPAPSAAGLLPPYASAPEPPPSPSVAQGHRALARALLVDDSATVRLLEEMMLSEAGYSVDALADGAEALARALSYPYGLLVTSIETRGLPGLDLAAALRNTPTGRALPIIVMSSDDNPAHRQRAAALGVQAYIRKGPLGERRLLDTARDLLAAPDP